MSDSSQGPGWWLASDGRWYPPNDGGEAPGPDWWLASDGKWYPPVRSERPGPGWWLASDGKWYAPESRENATTKAPVAAPSPPAVTAAPPAPPSATAATGDASEPEGRSGRGRDKSKAPRLGRVGRRRRERADVDEASDAPSSGAPAPIAASPDRREPAARAEVPMQDRVRPNVNEGVTPQDQIERRNQASRADAGVLAAKRAQAATRALGALGALGEIDNLRPKVPVAEPTPAPATTPTAAAAPAAPAPLPVTRAAPTPAPTPPSPTVSTPAPSAPTPAPSVAQPSEPAPEPRTEVQPPLLEVAGTADVDHTRDQLAIFTDRVELRDRLDRVRTSIKADDIIGVNVQTTASGAVLSVESMNGPDIAATGLRAEQAEEARRLILAKTRPARVASMSTGQAPAAAAPAPAPAKPARFDGPELVGKLADLRRAGILTEEEYQQKLVLVRRLAAGEPEPQPAT